MSRNQKGPTSWRPFEEARRYVQTLGLKSQQAWKIYCRSGQKPEDIPSDPGRAYEEAFLGYGDWLGTGNVATKNRAFRPFEEARRYVRTLGLKNHQEWKAYCHSEKKPEDIPSNPNEVYQDYQGMADWIGTCNRWSKKSLIAFLEHLSHLMPLLTEKELYMILQQEGVFPYLCRTLERSSPLQALTALQDMASETLS